MESPHDQTAIQAGREAFIRSNRVNDLFRTKKGPYRHLKWLFLVLFLYGLLVSTAAGRHTPFMIAIVLVVYWYLLRWPVNRFYCRRKFRLHTSADEDIEITVDEKGFRGGTESSRGEFTWGAESRIVEVTDGFLILQYPIFYWISLKAFAKGADVEWFREQAQERAKEFAGYPW